MTIFSCEIKTIIRDLSVLVDLAQSWLLVGGLTLRQTLATQLLCQKYSVYSAAKQTHIVFHEDGQELLQPWFDYMVQTSIIAFTVTC